jgi:hypothetical protein
VDLRFFRPRLIQFVVVIIVVVIIVIVVIVVARGPFCLYAG